MRIDNPAGTAILLANRGDQDLKLVRSVLRKVGFGVVNSDNGTEALALAAKESSALRLVVANPATPGLNFPQFLEKLHQAAPDVPVLCLTEEAAGRAFCAEYPARLLKRPFRRAHLLSSILDITDKPLFKTA